MDKAASRIRLPFYTSTVVLLQCKEALNGFWSGILRRKTEKVRLRNL